MYEYIGDKHNDLPHGKGKFIFTNKNIYEGECKFGFPDGFGKYIFSNGDILTGFFSAGEINGLGTFENSNIITKGSWRNNKKHGNFVKTKKDENKTFKELWQNDKLISQSEIEYYHPEILMVTKKRFKNKKYNRTFNNKAKCGECNNIANATSTECGHVYLCYTCLIKYKICPICMIPIEKYLVLFSK